MSKNYKRIEARFQSTKATPSGNSPEIRCVISLETQTLVEEGRGGECDDDANELHDASPR